MCPYLVSMVDLIHFSVDVSLPLNISDGDFLYTRQDLDAMKYDMIRLSPLVDGFVIGVLTAGGKVDSGACKFLMKDLPAAEGLEFTFHRAFDMCRDAFEAAEVILDSGFARVLTSGQERSVASGGKLIRRLNETFKGRLSFMPGGGINEQNLSGILAASGSAEFHASAKSTRESGMEFRNEKCRMGDKGDDEFNINVTSEERVRKMVQIFNDR